MPKSEFLQTAGIGFFTEDKQGRLWIACRQGLYSSPIKELTEFMAGNGARPPISRFSDQDDLHDQDFSSSGSSASATDENGFLWFANGSELVRVDTRSIRLNTERPEVVLTDVLAGSRSHITSGVRDQEVKLPHRASPVTYRFQARAFTSPENVFYEYRSKLTDGKWIGNGRSRELRFTDLRSGRHSIEVRAINSDGLGREQGSIFSVYVEPFIWETIWFQSAGGLLAVSAVFAAGRRVLKTYVRRREINLEQREAAARAELQRVSREADRMRLEARLQEAQRLEALGTLAGGIAHDFNNLLQSILGNAELGRMKLDKPGDVKEHLDEVVKASDRARALVAQILLFSRREKPQKIPLFAGPIVKESLKLLRSGISPDIQIIVNIPDSLPPVSADPSAIQRIVTNLGTNAAHSMRDVGGAMTIRLEAVDVDAAQAAEIAGIKPGDYVCLTVSDTGHGMDVETQRRAFEPFFTTKAPGEGTGLGLSVVQGLVHSLEGGIRVQSDIGIGSRFDIYLPVTREIPSNSAPAAASPANGASLRVLVVDDDRTVLDFAVAALRQLGHRPEGVIGAENALAKFRRSPISFDMIVTDLTMPGMDGKAFAQAAKASRLDIPIILATGYGQGMDETAAEKSGFEALMPKPYNIETLAAVIRRVRARRLN
jgi:signal transduction histidine kinase/ActR/RegA family two-component response regulator